jgi:hypothetical protein
VPPEWREIAFELRGPELCLRTAFRDGVAHTSHSPSPPRASSDSQIDCPSFVARGERERSGPGRGTRTLARPSTRGTGAV